MSDITMTYPQRSSRTHSDLFWQSDLFGLFKAELARAGAITVDAGASLWPHFAACYQGVARLPRKARRALQKRWRRSLGGIALLYALGHAPAALAGQIDVGLGGCTLVDAITAANTDKQTGGCPAGRGADTITLPAASTQLLTAAGPYSYYGSTGLPIVSSAIVIDGNGSTIARDPQAPEFRIFAITSAGDLVLQETTITGGTISTSSGGGIFNYGTLTLTDSTVSGNSADGSGGLRNSGTLTLINSTVSGNSASGSGGGLRNSGTLILTNSTVSGNSAYGSGGGGLHNEGSLTLTNSTVSGNSASGSGGGVFTYGGTLTLDQSLVSGNSTSSQGPEVYNSSGEGGPGILITNGFNLFGHDGMAGVDGVASGAPGATDLVPTVPLNAILAPTLADHGGPTRPHALVIGSPAIDAVPAASCVTTGDQRGVTRPEHGDAGANADCDIGAFELQLPPPPPTTPPPPPPPPPLLPEAKPVEQTPQVQCLKSACRVRIKCDAVQGSVEPCRTSVVIFVRASAVRLDDGSATKVANRIRFAAGTANIPPGGAANVRLRLTK